MGVSATRGSAATPTRHNFLGLAAVEAREHIVNHRTIHKGSVIAPESIAIGLRNAGKLPKFVETIWVVRIRGLAEFCT